MRNHLLRAASANVSSGIVTTNLKQHWDFGNSSSYSGSGSNNDTVTDLSGNSNHGTLNGDSSRFSTNTANGGYLEMNHGGQSTFGRIDRDTDVFNNIGTDDFTLEFWIQVKSNNSDYYDLIFIDISSAASFAERFILTTQLRRTTSPFNGQYDAPGHNAGPYPNSPNTNFITEIGTTSLYDTSGNSFSGWMHFVYSRTGTSNGDVKLYKNKTLLGTGMNNTNYQSSQDSSYASIGYQNVLLFLRANLAIYRLYSGTGLTAAQVEQNYNTDKARFGL